MLPVAVSACLTDSRLAVTACNSGRVHTENGDFIPSLLLQLEAMKFGTELLGTAIPPANTALPAVISFCE